MFPDSTDAFRRLPDPVRDPVHPLTAARPPVRMGLTRQTQDDEYPLAFNDQENSTHLDEENNTYPFVFLDGGFWPEEQGAQDVDITRPRQTEPRCVVRNLIEGPCGYIPENTPIFVWLHRRQWWTLYTRAGVRLATARLTDDLVPTQVQTDVDTVTPLDGGADITSGPGDKLTDVDCWLGLQYPAKAGDLCLIAHDNSGNDWKIVAVFTQPVQVQVVVDVQYLEGPPAKVQVKRRPVWCFPAGDAGAWEDGPAA